MSLTVAEVDAPPGAGDERVLQVDLEQWIRRGPQVPPGITGTTQQPRGGGEGAALQVSHRPGQRDHTGQGQRRPGATCRVENWRREHQQSPLRAPLRRERPLPIWRDRRERVVGGFASHQWMDDLRLNAGWTGHPKHLAGAVRAALEGVHDPTAPGVGVTDVIPALRPQGRSDAHRTAIDRRDAPCCSYGRESLVRKRTQTLGATHEQPCAEPPVHACDYQV